MSSLRPRNLLFVVPSLAGGGAERVVSTLLQTMDRARFSLSLVVLRGAVEPGLALPADVKVYHLGGRRLRSALGEIIKIVREARPDIVMSTLDHLNVGLCALRLFWPRGTRLVIRATDLMNVDDPGMSLAMRFAYRFADGIIYQSEAMRDVFVKRIGLRGTFGAVIRNPVMLDHVRRRASEPLNDPLVPNEQVLVCAGRLAHAKGFDIMLEALAMMDREDFRVVVLGEGSDRSALEAHRDRLGLRGRVEFIGHRENPYAFFSRSRGFLLSSRYEGFPNVVLEALACGTAVISTPVPGVAGLLDSIPGCVLASGHSAAEVAQALSAFMDMPKCEISRHEVASYDAVKISHEYGDFFESVLSRFGRHH